MLTYRTVQNSAANCVFFVSVLEYAFSKSTVFATNFEQFAKVLDYEQALRRNCMAGGGCRCGGRGG